MARLYTLSTVMSEATYSIGQRSDLALSRASFFANQAYLEVWEALPHNEQEKLAVSSTTSGENRITLPSDYGETIALSDLSASQPTLLRVLNSDDVDSSSTLLGRPTAYVEYANWLELWPSPDSAYSIQMRYRAQPSVLTTTTAESSLATRYDYAWFLKTCEMYCRAVGDIEQAPTWANEYTNYMLRTRSDLAKRQSAREGMSVRYLTGRRGALSRTSWDADDGF